MPIVPGNIGAVPILPKDVVDEKWLLMAAAQMHEMGRLVEPPHDPNLRIDRKDIDRDFIASGDPAAPPAIDERYPDLEREGEDQQRELDRTRQMREREEEFETDMFKLRRGR